MATCSAIATRLDEEMLADRPAIVYPSGLETLAGPNAGRLFDLFEQARHGCGR